MAKFKIIMIFAALVIATPLIASTTVYPSVESEVSEDEFHDAAQLRDSTEAMLLSTFSLMGLIHSLPRSISNWNRPNSSKEFFDNFTSHVTSPPVWDNDHFTFNYLGHPYIGAVYYVAARDAGLSSRSSFLYALGMSTFFEYVIESPFERPSFQDLLVTPVTGWLLGEYVFFPLYEKIVANHYELAGSKALGKAVAFVLNPAPGLVRLFGVDKSKSMTLKIHPFGLRAADKSSDGLNKNMRPDTDSIIVEWVGQF